MLYLPDLLCYIYIYVICDSNESIRLKNYGQKECSISKKIEQNNSFRISKFHYTVFHAQAIIR